MKKACATCGAELPPDGFCVSCLLGLAVAGSPARSEAPHVPMAGAVEKAGERIGAYKLLEMIGEGGMGRVWMAEQTEPIRRTVALKVIKAGLDSSQVLARFEAERQALALMDHPNIARVLDAGATPEGRPFFVMELVKGVHLTKFCEEQRLSISERLRLFAAVCQAIQHAHQKGIIHRDIKPGNVLVALYDGHPVPKVIDFGVAKATEQRLTERTLFTHFGAIVGTPEYMSPEQAELNQLDIDTRSDVYSLGVLLYELLTGTTPLSQEMMRRAAFDEVLRRIREEDPLRPSTLLLRGGVDLGAVSAQRQLEPRELLGALRGDLDWVVMKALEKERARRYDTANALALDVERFLSNEPVVARPPSRIYRLQKLARRNRLAFAAGAIALAMLFTGLGVTSWLLIKERQARERADGAERAQAGQRRKAELAAENSRQVAEFLGGMLQGVGPSVALGRDTTMLREILDKTGAQIGKELNNQPEVEANLRSTLCKVYADLGEYERAEGMGRRALEIKRRLLGTNHLEVAEALHDLARAETGRGKYPEAEALAREALAIRSELLGNSHVETAHSLDELGTVLLKRDKWREAENAFKESLLIYDKLAASTNRLAVAALGNLAAALHAQNKYAEAEPVYREAVTASKKILGVHPQVAGLLNELGLLLADQSKLADAELVLREAAGMRRNLMGKVHPDYASSMSVLGHVLLKRGKYREVEEFLIEDLVPAFLNDARSAPLLRVRARMSARRSQWPAAAADFWRVIEFDPSNHFNYLQLAPILVQLGDVEGYRRLCGRMVAEFGETKDIAIAERMTKASLLLPIPDADMATLNRWSEMAVREGQGHVYLPYYQFSRSLLAYRNGAFASAAGWMEKVLRNEGGKSKASLRDAQALMVLATARFKLNQNEEARDALTRGLGIFEKTLGPSDSGDLLSSWHDWLISQIFIQEAKALIEPKNGP